MTGDSTVQSGPNVDLINEINRRGRGGGGSQGWAPDSEGLLKGTQGVQGTNGLAPGPQGGGLAKLIGMLQLETLKEFSDIVQQMPQGVGVHAGDFSAHYSNISSGGAHASAANSEPPISGFSRN